MIAMMKLYIEMHAILEKYIRWTNIIHIHIYDSDDEALYWNACNSREVY